MCVSTLRRTDRETGVVLRHELPLQKAVRRLERRDPLQPQRLHQPILKRPVTSLHTALRLRRMRADQLHVQVPHRTTELRLRWRSRQRFLAIRCSIHTKNAVPIHVQRPRQTTLVHVVTHHRHCRLRRLRFEELRLDPVRRVVDHHHQHCPGPPTLEPIVMRSVHLNQLAEHRTTRSPRSMGRAATARLPSSFSVTNQRRSVATDTSSPSFAKYSAANVGPKST